MMALTIDAKHLAEVVLPEQEAYLNSLAGGTGRFQLERVTVFAVVFHGNDFLYPLFDGWEDLYGISQHDDQGDEKDSLEVLHELKQLAAKTISYWHSVSSPSNSRGWPKKGATVLVANAQSPSFTAPSEEDPPSSSHRFSLKLGADNFGYSSSIFTDLQSVIPNFPARPRVWEQDMHVKICSSTIHLAHREGGYRFWRVQLDFVDHSSPAYSFPSRIGRRTLNPFHHVSPRREEPAANRFKGVRYRPDHKIWYAEMTPPGRRKVYLGSFETEAEAARVVDVAFHHFGKELNFPDTTPRILSKQPRSKGLGDEEKLRLVKEQVEWMKPMLPDLASSREPMPVASGPSSFEIPSTVDTTGLLSFSAIGSSSVIRSADLADDGISRARPWMEATEQNFHGDEMQWSADSAFVARVLPEHAPGGTRISMRPGSVSAAEPPLGSPSLPSMSPPFRVWTPPDQPQDIDAPELGSLSFTFCADV